MNFYLIILLTIFKKKIEKKFYFSNSKSFEKVGDLTLIPTYLLNIRSNTRIVNKKK